jgi:uncharacterized protein (DUF1501 family)
MVMELRSSQTSGTPVHRRSFLKLGSALLGGLTLADVLRLRAAASGTTPATPDTAVIFISLGGGPSHFETYDPKPNAPAEYRGEFRPVATNVAGIQLCELLPRQAQIMDKLAIVRSIHHREASHIALHMVETGYFLRSSANALRGEMPAVGSVVARVRGQSNPDIPSFVSLPRPNAYTGPHFLGSAYQHFAVNDDPAAPEFRVNNLALHPNLNLSRLDDRRALQQLFDEERQIFDLNNDATAIDDFNQQAFDLVAGERARTAFDLSREDERLRDRYGRNSFGQRLVLARRLAEAGVPYIVVRSNDWDDHQGLPDRMRRRCPEYDIGVTALIEDLHQRGLNRKVLVVAMGEFGRTPRVNPTAGRDHWPSVMSVMLACGTIRTGQAVGASDARGAAAQDRPYAPQSVLTMVYHHLGIDPAMTFLDYSGRPRYILEEREPIRELL